MSTQARQIPATKIRELAEGGYIERAEHRPEGNRQLDVVLACCSVPELGDITLRPKVPSPYAPGLSQEPSTYRSDAQSHWVRQLDVRWYPVSIFGGAASFRLRLILAPSTGMNILGEVVHNFLHDWLRLVGRQKCDGRSVCNHIDLPCNPYFFDGSLCSVHARRSVRVAPRGCRGRRASRANGSPARFLLLRTKVAKERLRPALAPGNVEKTDVRACDGSGPDFRRGFALVRNSEPPKLFLDFYFSDFACFFPVGRNRKWDTGQNSQVTNTYVYRSYGLPYLPRGIANDVAFRFDCITKRLGLERRQQAQQATSALGRTGKFLRSRGRPGGDRGSTASGL